MRIAVLFDGAGLARRGLELAGHSCVGFELDPVKHHLASLYCDGPGVLGDVRDADLSGFDAVWASPPCQTHSIARTQGKPGGLYADDLLQWSLSLPHKVLWVENVLASVEAMGRWGVRYNAFQFGGNQGRNRIVGGRFTGPVTLRPYQYSYPKERPCPCITATEWRGCATDKRRASRWFGRKATLAECAVMQGMDDLPDAWLTPPDWFAAHHKRSRAAGRSNDAWYSVQSPATAWTRLLYEAIGNGVPVHMARAFGEVYRGCKAAPSAPAQGWGALPAA